MADTDEEISELLETLKRTEGIEGFDPTKVIDFNQLPDFKTDLGINPRTGALTLTSNIQDRLDPTYQILRTKNSHSCSAMRKSLFPFLRVPRLAKEHDWFTELMKRDATSLNYCCNQLRMAATGSVGLLGSIKEEIKAASRQDRYADRFANKIFDKLLTDTIKSLGEMLEGLETTHRAYNEKTELYPGGAVDFGPEHDLSTLNPRQIMDLTRSRIATRSEARMQSTKYAVIQAQEAFSELLTEEPDGTGYDALLEEADTNLKDNDALWSKVFNAFWAFTNAHKIASPYLETFMGLTELIKLAEKSENTAEIVTKMRERIESLPPPPPHPPADTETSGADHNSSVHTTMVPIQFGDHRWDLKSEKVVLPDGFSSLPTTQFSE